MHRIAIKPRRDAERAFVAQAQGAYVRFVATWSERPKTTRRAPQTRSDNFRQRGGDPIFPALGRVVAPRAPASELRRAAPRARSVQPCTPLVAALTKPRNSHYLL